MDPQTRHVVWEASEIGKIVGLSVFAAVVYGVVHDQITARVCLEYFTVGHVDVAGHDPTIVALYWGVVATWWVGLTLGIGLAISARSGPRAPVSARDLAPRVAWLVTGLFVVAMLSGLIGYARVASGVATLGSSLAAITPEERHGFVFDAWAHSASYLGGAIGGLGLCLVTYVRRPILAAVDPGSQPSRWVGLGCLAGVLAPVLYVVTSLLFLNYEGGNRPRVGAPYSIDDMGVVLFVLVYGAPWIEIVLALIGIGAWVKLLRDG